MISPGTNEPPPVENWRIFRRLIGHDNDVQDLGWSYDSSILVSVGLDSKVVVWSGHTFEKLKTIALHQSHVKGITFDPANKYFATASDDRTIKIFRFTPPGPNASAHDQMNNFTHEKTIPGPFTASPLTTYFRRCSWSPDGNHIAAANAVNGPVSAVAIINRGTWDGDINLIGHEAPVEVCAFSPRLFTKQAPIRAPPDGKGQQLQHLVTVIACAGQDKALSIWITSNPRPLTIIQDLAIKSISDLAWAPDGKKLFVTSLDGSIIAIMFDDTELGFEVGLEENEKSLAKFGAGRRGAGIIEGTNGLLLEERSREGELRGVEGRMGALMGDTSNAPTVTADVIQSNNPVTNGLDGAADHANGTKPAAEYSVDNCEESKPKEDPNAAKLESLKQRVTITKDGKKRIAPLLVSSAEGQESSLPRAQLMASTASGQSAGDGPHSILDLSKPFDGLPKGGLAALLLGNKRKLAEVEAVEDGPSEKRLAVDSQNSEIPIMTNTVNGLVPAKSTTATTGQQPTPDFIRPAVTNPSLIPSQVRLAVPRVRAHIVQNYDRSGTIVGSGQTNGLANGTTSNQATQADLTFEARNPVQSPATGRSQDAEPSRVTLTRRGQPVWQDYLPRSALLATGNLSYWSIACEDGSIYVWSAAGRRLVNAMVLESQPVILECRDHWLLCVTAVGMCYVWDLKSLSSPHPPVSLAPVLDIAVHHLQNHPTRAPAVTSARVNSEGRIIVTLTNGDGYAYSPTMFVWQRLSEVFWAVGSQYSNSMDTSVGNLQSSVAPGSDRSGLPNVSAGIIPYLERNTTTETLIRGRAYFLQKIVKQLLSREGFEGFEAGVSIAHLENRVAAAMMLGAKDEFRVYLHMYAKRIGAEGLRTKVEELMRSIMGSIQDNEGDPGVLAQLESKSSDRIWDNPTNFICGWSRKELLKEVVLILGNDHPVPVCG